MNINFFIKYSTFYVMCIMHLNNGFGYVWGKTGNRKTRN